MKVLRGKPEKTLSWVMNALQNEVGGKGEGGGGLYIYIIASL